MKSKYLLFAAAVLLLIGCNRSQVRIYGASGSFPHATTNFAAKTPHSQTVYIQPFKDIREEYHGISVAGTSWQGTRTDSYTGYELQNILHSELTQEMKKAGLFSGVDDEPKDLVLETEIRTFGSQARGFIWLRVAGLSSFHFVLKRGDEVLLDKVYEKVVTDGDPEYTGRSVGFIEQVMRVTMSDSYREILKKLFADLENLEI